MASEIRIGLAAETAHLLAIMEKQCARDKELSIVSRSSSLRLAARECITKQLDVLVIWVENAGDEAMALFRSVLASTHTGVVLLTNNTVLIVEAITNGLSEFITYSSMPDDEMRNNVAMRISAAAKKVHSKAEPKTRPAPLAAKIKETQQMRFRGVIALGASAGGTEATSVVLRQLPANLPGMLVVQHIPPVFSRMFAERLNSECALNVREARDGDILTPGTVLVAPGERQMTLTRKAEDYAVQVRQGERVRGHCPSVDVMFHSVAAACGSNAVGIILTGMGDDGARGLLQMRRAGAFTIGQDERTSMVYGMPRVAYEMGGVVKQAALEKIPELLLQHLSRG